MRRVFAGSDRRRVRGTALAGWNIGAHRRWLRHLARRPATAAAMAPGFWRLSVARGISLRINLRILNRIAREGRPFRCGLIPSRCPWRSSRRRGSPPAPPPPAWLLRFAVLQ